MSHAHNLFLCSDESDSVSDKSYDSKPDVEELEMLLEAYFAQINGILQKLLSVRIIRTNSCNVAYQLNL
jgi:hypothetical protein